MSKKRKQNIYLSVVIPILNEKDNIKEVHDELAKVLQSLKSSYEIIYIDDGSRDGTTKILTKLAKKHQFVNSIIFRRNFGQTAAFAAGINYAIGKIIITMDGDQQNDPNDIPKIMDKIKQGFDVVSGWRYKRQDPFLRCLLSRIANRIISWVTKVQLHDYGCSLKAYRQEALKPVRIYGEMHRFIPALCYYYGADITEIKVNHRPRRKGVSKYGLSRTIRVILDLITVKFLLTFSTRPSHIFGFIGLLSFIIGFAINAYLTYLKLALDQSIGNRPLLLLGVLLIFVGLQFICFGLLAEMLARVYHESQQKPIYSIKKIV